MSQEEKRIGEKSLASLADDLEPYRRLVELQKQMVGLVRQHEKTKSECAALRAQLLEEMTRLRRPRWTFRRISRPAAAWLKYLTALRKSRRENRPQPDASFLPHNRLIKV